MLGQFPDLHWQLRFSLVYNENPARMSESFCFDREAARMTATPCRRRFICGALAAGSLAAPLRFVDAVLPPAAGLRGVMPEVRALWTSSKVISAYVGYLELLDMELPDL